MSLSSIISWFKPRELIFFDLLEKSAGNLCDAIGFFYKELETNDPARWDDLKRRMKDYEHAGDAINKEVIDKLDQTFVTPIERDDILRLSHSLDDVVDHLDTVSQKIVLYQVGHIKPFVLEIARLLYDGASELMYLTQSIRNMSNVKEIRKRIRLVQELESKIDGIYNMSLAELFATCTDAIELIKWKGILENLEDASNSIDIVAKMVGSTITKNA